MSHAIPPQVPGSNVISLSSRCCYGPGRARRAPAAAAPALPWFPPLWSCRSRRLALASGWFQQRHGPASQSSSRERWQVTWERHWLPGDLKRFLSRGMDTVPGGGSSRASLPAPQSTKTPLVGQHNSFPSRCQQTRREDPSSKGPMGAKGRVLWSAAKAISRHGGGQSSPQSKPVPLVQFNSSLRLDRNQSLAGWTPGWS